ncbi:MAG: retropepsin-like aspartic protease [Chthoniobacterales bacterium]
MNWKSLPVLFFIVVIAGCSTPNREVRISDAPSALSTRGNRILIPAKINGHPVRFIFDTGADIAYLTVEAAQRLGLPTTRPLSATNSWMVGLTPPCALTISGDTHQQRFPVIEMGGPMGTHFLADGFLGWLCYSKSIFRIDATNLSVTAYNKVPDEVKTWMKFRLKPLSSKFIFEVPLPNGSVGDVFVDSGAPEGVGLYPEKWAGWKAEHPQYPLFVSRTYMPYQRTGVVFQEGMIADKISLGPLELTKVQVGETTSISNQQYSAPRRLATMGMMALKRMDVVVDAKHGFVYIRPR